MIKRVTKQEAKKEAAEAIGLDAAEAGAGYDDTSSSGSDDSSDEDSSDSSESEEEEQPFKSKSSDKKNKVDAKAAGSKRKRETADDGSDSDDSNDDSGDEEDSSDSDDGSDEQEEVKEMLRLPPMSTAQALSEPIFVPEGAPSKKGEEGRTCIFCPEKLLKSSNAVKVHLASAVSLMENVFYSVLTSDHTSPFSMYSTTSARGNDLKGTPSTSFQPTC